MASKFYYLSGKAKWARLFTPDDKYKNYKIDVALDDASKEVFAESGMQLNPKQADDGGIYLTFRRPESKVIKNELVKFEAPAVTDKEGNKVESLVGNGSDVTIKVVVYDTMKGKGHRLEAVRVDNLIPYEKPQEATPTVSAGAMKGTAAPTAALKKVMPF
jgi:hypothetical protein